MSEPKRAALLLAPARPETKDELEAFEVQLLACRLYAGNHDMVIVGRYGQAGTGAPSEDFELPVVERDGFDVVLAVTPLADDAGSAQFVEALEQLRLLGVDVTVIDRRET